MMNENHGSIPFETNEYRNSDDVEELHQNAHMING